MFVHLGHFPFCIPEGEPDELYLNVSLDDAMFLFWKAKKAQIKFNFSYTSQYFEEGVSGGIDSNGDPLPFLDLEMSGQIDEEISIFDKSEINERVCIKDDPIILSTSKIITPASATAEIFISFFSDSRPPSWDQIEYEKILKSGNNINIHTVIDCIIIEDRLYEYPSIKNKLKSENPDYNRLTQTINFKINESMYSTEVFAGALRGNIWSQDDQWAEFNSFSFDVIIT